MAGIGNRCDAKREFGLIDEATKRPVTVQFSENDLEIVTMEMISRGATVRSMPLSTSREPKLLCIWVASMIIGW